MPTAQSLLTTHDLELLSPEELLVWAQEEYGHRAGIITSFQDTGCAIVDMAQRVAPSLRIITIDTLRLHSETYALIDRIESHYDIRVERFRPDPERLQNMLARYGEYLFFDGKAGQQLCCHVRKVEPNRRALETLSIWFTGLRRDQSEHRAETAKATHIWQGDSYLLKIAPLADWTESEVNDYLDIHGVPRNALYSKGYTSIGCEICTAPTRDDEDKRAGRWRWFNSLGGDKKECGIHINGSGI